MKTSLEPPRAWTVAEAGGYARGSAPRLGPKTPERSMKPNPDPTAPGLTLHAGPLHATFDRGELRWVRLGEVEVLRGIYPAVRGSGLAHRAAPHLRPAHRAGGGPLPGRATTLRYEDGPLRFAASVRIDGAPDGTVRFELRGRAETAFLKNRIGLCVLHPSPSCAGRPVEVEHGDGRVTRASFPAGTCRRISPSWTSGPSATRIAPGRALEVRFEGEWFEMEDQRNWSDASFKTYSTPLSRPFPARMEAGDEVRHEVTLRLRDGPARPLVVRPRRLPRGAARSLAERPATVRCAWASISALRRRAPSAADVERLRALRLDHLRIALGREGGWGEALARAAETARACGVPLEVAALLGEDGGLEHLAEAAAGPARVRVPGLPPRHTPVRPRTSSRGRVHCWARPCPARGWAGGPSLVRRPQPEPGGGTGRRGRELRAVPAGARPGREPPSSRTCRASPTWPAPRGPSRARHRWRSPR